MGAKKQSDVGKLFKHDEKKKVEVKKPTKQETDDAKVVEQQKAMLKQQKQAMKNKAKSQSDVGKLFKHDKKKTAEVKKPTKQEQEDAQVVDEQKAMLKQQKKAMKDKAKKQSDVGKLFKHDKKKKVEVKKPTKQEVEDAQVVDAQKAMLKQQKQAM